MTGTEIQVTSVPAIEDLSSQFPSRGLKYTHAGSETFFSDLAYPFSAIPTGPLCAGRGLPSRGRFLDLDHMEGSVGPTDLSSLDELPGKEVQVHP